MFVRAAHGCSVFGQAWEAAVLVGYHDLDAPILLHPRGRVVVADRVRLAEPDRFDAARIDLSLDQRVTHRGRAPLRKLQVVIFGASRVRVPLDQHVALRMLPHELRDLLERAGGAGLQRGLVAREQHVAERDHESALRLHRLQALEIRLDAANARSRVTCLHRTKRGRAPIERGRVCADAQRANEHDRQRSDILHRAPSPAN